MVLQFLGNLLIRHPGLQKMAGVGSAAIAHSAVQTKRPVTEGIVALYEPFVDTVVVCTITVGLLLPAALVLKIARESLLVQL